MKLDTALRLRARASRPPAHALIALAALLAGCGLIMRQTQIAYIAVNGKFAPKQVEITIHKSFIEKYKNRVQIHATFTVDKAMETPSLDAVDGDLHFAGRSPQVALPVVAEIANAIYYKSAVDLVHGAEASGKTLEVTGVWRIWPEHAGSAVEEQGKTLPALTTNTPDHVFEIHPVTEIEDVDLRGTFTVVKGFTPGGAQRTFEIYQKAPVTLTIKADAISIVTETGLYNDAEFIMQIGDSGQKVVSDGRFVFSAALDLDGKVVAPNLRMVFAKGTPPELAVRHLKSGDRLHVYAIPRFDFADISRRVREHPRDSTLLKQPLPYEMIILGVYPK
jgi:hypothetical protein